MDNSSALILIWSLQMWIYPHVSELALDVVLWFIDADKMLFVCVNHTEDFIFIAAVSTVILHVAQQA